MNLLTPRSFSAMAAAFVLALIVSPAAEAQCANGTCNRGAAAYAGPDYTAGYVGPYAAAYQTPAANVRAYAPAYNYSTPRYNGSLYAGSPYGAVSPYSGVARSAYYGTAGYPYSRSFSGFPNQGYGRSCGGY